MNSHRKSIMKISVLALALFAVGGVAVARNHHRNARSESPGTQVILAFGSMYGVDGGFVGATNPIRGVIGDELPWEVDGSARGVLTSDGHLRVRVRGLVFTHDIEVPPELQGTNDETQFRALVSCMSEDATGAVTTAKVATEGFAANTEGDSDIDAQITLPSPCVAPIVFVLAGSEDKWFAVTGFEAGAGGGTGNHGDHDGDDGDDGDDDDHNGDGGDDD